MKASKNKTNIYIMLGARWVVDKLDNWGNSICLEDSVWRQDYWWDKATSKHNEW